MPGQLVATQEKLYEYRRQEVNVGSQIGLMTPLVLEQKGDARKTHIGEGRLGNGVEGV